MPQFDFAHVFWPQVAWLAVFFVVLYFGVVRLTLPKLDKVMGQREDKIGGDLDVARASKDQADAIQAAYEAELAAARDAARLAISDAKADAAKASEKRLATAGEKADKLLADAEGRIAGAVAAAEQSLRDAAAEGAQAIVARLTGATPAVAGLRQSIDARLKA
ncbi:MAG: ATPase [Candidatus Andeanibacterium colombiense]|uniref:ATP synthase subunit b n=1 Tax=Candidatus Andeanibacterium colombiense TaxID=3121345 RepID=A0AAJ5X3X0_9SPHN|nr:MAG: ATPase [Sphingomonadaceae bacterium]